MEWHIDAWDSRGGRAFATQRTQNADIGDPDEEVWGPTVFIGPPSFRPEQLANIGIALSARRSGSFDPRVPMNPNAPEASFNTADAVADFVRRAFTGSVRNRGGDGGGAIGFEGGPEGPPPSDGGEPTIAERFIGEWMDGIQTLEKNPHFHSYFVGSQLPHIFVAQPPAKGQLESVQSGALQVLATVLDAVPLYGLNSFLFEQWRMAATSLDAALTELGLWRGWFTAPDHERVNISNYLRHRSSALLKANGQAAVDGVVFAQMLLRWQPSSADPNAAAKRFWVSVRHAEEFADDNCVVDPAPPAERYEALFGWPLPRYVNLQPPCRSVGELLATFVSSPTAFSRGTPGALDIVAFAAALLASRNEDRRFEGWRERAAATWLAQSVPQWLFREDLEALILDPEQKQVLAGVGV